MANHELDALDPVPEQVKLASGTVVALEDLKARQFFKLLRILTRGAMPVLQDLSIFKIDGDTSVEEFTTRLMTLLLLAVPEAENETIEFVTAMVKPVGLIEGRKLNKQDTERNNELWYKVVSELDNPELDDLVTIIEAIVRREAADIQALGKRLSAMFKLAQKTGQLPAFLSPQMVPAPISSEDSPGSSTSSPTNTDGTTDGSPTSPSVAFDNASLPFVNGPSTSSGSTGNG